MRKLRLKELKLLAQSYSPTPGYESILSDSHGHFTIVYGFLGKSDINPALERNFEQNFLTVK